MTSDQPLNCISNQSTIVDEGDLQKANRLKTPQQEWLWYSEPVNDTREMETQNNTTLSERENVDLISEKVENLNENGNPKSFDTERETVDATIENVEKLSENGNSKLKSADSESENVVTVKVEIQYDGQVIMTAGGVKSNLTSLDIENQELLKCEKDNQDRIDIEDVSVLEQSSDNFSANVDSKISQDSGVDVEDATQIIIISGLTEQISDVSQESQSSQEFDTETNAKDTDDEKEITPQFEFRDEDDTDIKEDVDDVTESPGTTRNRFKCRIFPDPVVKAKKCRKRKKKLELDKLVQISTEDMKMQVKITSDVVQSLDLAPPTKKLMQFREKSELWKLFTLPGRHIFSNKLSDLYYRNQATKNTMDTEDNEASYLTDYMNSAEYKKYLFARAKDKERKLIYENEVENSETELRLPDTSNLISALDLAPPTKQLMEWKVTHEVKNLLHQPGRSGVSKTISKLITRNMFTTKDPPDTKENQDDEIHLDIVDQSQELNVKDETPELDKADEPPELDIKEEPVKG